MPLASSVAPEKLLANDQVNPAPLPPAAPAPPPLLAEALLESDDDPEAVRHFGSRVLVESTRMGNMVNELIALSRLQGAEKLPDLGSVEVDDVVGPHPFAQVADVHHDDDPVAGAHHLGGLRKSLHGHQ